MIGYLLLMEFAKKKGGGVLIQNKNVRVAVDPQDASDADICIFVDTSSSLLDKKLDCLVVEGPGEYEYQGITIHGEKNESGVYYVVSDGSESYLIVRASGLSLIGSDESYDVMLVRLDANIDDSNLSSLSAKNFFAYGDKSHIEHIPGHTSLDKVGVRKRSEVSNSVVLLS